MNSPSFCPSSELWGELERAVSCKWNHNSFPPRPFFFTCCCELTWAILKPKCNHNLLMISRPVLPSSRKAPHSWFIKVSERLKVTLLLLQQMSLVGETETLRLSVSSPSSQVKTSLFYEKKEMLWVLFKSSYWCGWVSPEHFRKY